MLKPSKRVVLSLFLIFIVLLSAVYVQPATASEFQKQLIEVRRHRLRGEIGIFYDPFDAVISETARDVFTALDLANVSSSLHEVSSVFELEVSLNESGVWIAIYLFRSGLENITLGQDVLGWEDFADVLLKFKNVHHILGIGNVRQLAKYVSENPWNIHLSDNDLTDARLTFLYSLWTVAEVLDQSRDYRHKASALDIRRVGLQFFADNFNDLFERTLEPKVPLGEEDLVEKQKRFERLMKRFRKGVRELPPIPPGEMTPNEVVKARLNSQNVSVAKSGLSSQNVSVAEEEGLSGQNVAMAEGSVPPPRLYLVNMPDSDEMVSVTGNPTTETLFKVLDLPLLSGLDGPVGKVVDLLLETLIGEGKDSAAMGGETVNKILGVIGLIDKVVGIVKDFDGESTLKELFDIVKKEWPVAEEYEEYFDLFIEALQVFRERDDMERVLNFVLKALKVVFSAVAPRIKDEVDVVLNVLSQLLDIGTDLYHRIEGSDKVFNAVLSWFNEKIMSKTVLKFLNETAEAVGLNLGQILDAAKMIVELVSAAIDFVVNSDVKALLSFIYEKVLKAYFLDVDIGPFVFGQIARAIELVTTVLGYSDPVEIELDDLFDGAFSRYWQTMGLAPQGVDVPSLRQDIVDLAEEMVGNHYAYSGGSKVYPDDWGFDWGWVKIGEYAYVYDRYGPPPSPGQDEGFWVFQIREGVYDKYKDRENAQQYLFSSVIGPSYWDKTTGYGGNTASRIGDYRESNRYPGMYLMPRVKTPNVRYNPDTKKWEPNIRPDGEPYRLFDCSSLVFFVYKRARDSNGKRFIPVTNGGSAGSLAKNYPRFNDLAYLNPGDLVYHLNAKGKVDHVGIYIEKDSDGRHWVIHANGHHRGVVKDYWRDNQAFRNYWNGGFGALLGIPLEAQIESSTAPAYPQASKTASAPNSIEDPRSIIRSLVEKITFEISKSIEEKEKDVNDFKRRILQHINDTLTEAGIQAPESTKNLLADVVTLAAGVMNAEFVKSEALPTLLTVIHDILEDNPIGVELADPEVIEAGLEDELPDEEIFLKLATPDTIDKINNIVTSTLGIAALFKDDANIKQVIARTAEDFDSQFGSIKGILKDLTELALSQMGLNASDISTLIDKIETVGTIVQTIFNLLKAFKENKVQGLMQTLLMGSGYSLIHYFANKFQLTEQFDLDLYVEILEAIFPRIMGVEPPTPEEIAEKLTTALADVTDWPTDWPTKDTIVDTVKTVTDLAMDAEKIFSDGYKWIFGQVMDWLAGEVEDLLDELTGGILSEIEEFSFFHLEGDFSLGLGDFSAFQLSYDLALDAGINLKFEELFDFVGDIIFDGLDWESGGTGDVFKRILSFVEITPTFKASIEVGGFGSEEDPLMSGLLESLGLELTFEGGAHLNIELFSFKGGVFESGFMKVVEWGFYFKIEVSRDFTLFDLVTWGVGGGAIITLGEYIGLDTIVLTISFGLTVEIVKRAASPTGPEQATFSLIIEIGVALSFSLTLYIVFLGGIPVTLDFYGSIQVIFTFAQDLLGDTPLKIVMDIVATVKVTIESLYLEVWSFDWNEKLYSHSFTGDPEDQPPDKKVDALGSDSDEDGLSDDYEETVPGLKPDQPDSDRDRLTDKEESQTTKTDPTKKDTDGDGLDDYKEIKEYKSNPKRVDTDYDGLSDYEEVMIYGTKPTVMDSDEDGLDDYYEINHVWDIPPNVTTSVKEVWIGDVAYNDHTDPLDPDTDNDGLLDGEEGPAGPYYGLSILYNETNDKVDLTKLYDDPEDPNYDPSTPDDKPLIFNYGYTHPLDNDTDDDSYLQLWNGSLVKGENVFLRSMTDGEEVKGIWVTFITEGEPNRTLVRTNPVNPDTDGDTGATRRTDVPPDRYLNSDGYELSLNPPTDPTNADSDHDGLIDGLEGVLNPYPESYHTNPTNPDTDGDGLGDMQEVLLETDPRNADTDFDLVLDGDEYHRFHTNPHLADSDHDGLEDYEELFFWHSNPNLRDSDDDGISDGQEVLKYDTDPMDEDTDNDGLTDYDEIFKHRTDPFNPDTDGDDLRDYEEAKIYLTDPLNWDTDGDSILYPNEYGQITWPMSDGEEVFDHGTDPARTDTDNDGLSDSIELYLGSGRIPRSVLEPIELNAINNDTDGDGLLDGQELRIGNTTSIIYPYLALMPYSFYNTSVLIADTDRDGLSDFEEVNGTLPNDRSFEAGVAKFNYTGSMADLWDTDNDTLSDGDEVFYHGTDPARADTDRDGLLDYYETTMNDTSNGGKSKTYYASLIEGETVVPGAPNASFSFSPVRQTVGQPVTFNASTSRDPDGTIEEYFWDFGDGTTTSDTSPVITHTYLAYGTYPVSLTVTDNDGLNSTVKGTVTIRLETSAIDPDTDGDLLPDGYEVDPDIIGNVTQRYGIPLDPLNPDANNNGILDGYEIDLDDDGLSDGEEFFIYKTQRTWRKGSFIAGGFLNFDSDGDGLSDGLEVYEFKSDPLKYDTDNDGYSDGAEIAAGTDPLTSTSPEEYQQALDRLKAGRNIRIISPLNTTTLDRNMNVRVLNSTPVETMWFRYNDGTGWSQDFTLEYDPAEEQWKNTTTVWGYKSYHIQVFGRTSGGYVYLDEVWFTVGELPPPQVGWIIKITSPINATIYDKYIDVHVVTSTSVQSVWFRYDSGAGWSNNFTMQYNSLYQRWEYSDTVWSEASYHLQVFTNTTAATVFWDELWFTIAELPAIGWITKITYPLNTTYYDNTIDVHVMNSTNVQDVWFRYNIATGWSSNITMQYNPAYGRWEYTTMIWDYRPYHIQAYARTASGEIYWDELWFTIAQLPPLPPPQVGWVLKITSPLNATTYDKDVDVYVVTSRDVNSVWFRYDSGAGWSNNFTMVYSPTDQRWENTTIVWSAGSHHLQVFTTTPTGLVYWDEMWFTVAEPVVKPPPVWLIRILSPPNTTIFDETVDVRVLNNTYAENVWFRYNDGTGWSSNYTLQYNSVNRQWQNTTIVWPEGSYHLQVFATAAGGDVVSDEVWFTIYVEKPPVEPSVQLYLLALGVVIGGAGTSAGFLLVQRRRRRAEMREGKGEAKKEGEK